MTCAGPVSPGWLGLAVRRTSRTRSLIINSGTISEWRLCINDTEFLAERRGPYYTLEETRCRIVAEPQVNHDGIRRVA